jgi:hypothetical protein
VTQIHEPPARRPPEQVDADRFEWPSAGPHRARPSAGRTTAIIVLYAAIGLGSATVGYALAGGRMLAGVASPAPVVSATMTPESEAAAQIVLTATLPPAPTATPIPPTPRPATVAPSVVPTAPPQPTVEPVAAKPDGAERTGQGAHIAVRPGMDVRQAQIDGTIAEYFEALGARDFARAQQVCCSAEWRARYPLDRWERNFDGVSDLHMVGQPRHVRTEDDVVVVDSDYTFVSGGTQRTLTLRWTFRPVGSQWQGELDEATAAQ